VAARTLAVVVGAHTPAAALTPVEALAQSLPLAGPIMAVVVTPGVGTIAVVAITEADTTAAVDSMEAVYISVSASRTLTAHTDMPPHRFRRPAVSMIRAVTGTLVRVTPEASATNGGLV